MTVHPLPAELDTLPVARPVFGTRHHPTDTDQPQLTSIRRNWIHAGPTTETDATDRTAARRAA